MNSRARPIRTSWAVASSFTSGSGPKAQGAARRGRDPFKQGPRIWLRQSVGAAAPSGLELAAPNLLEQVWSGDRSDASGARRPARCRKLREASDRGGDIQRGGTISMPCTAYASVSHLLHPNAFSCPLHILGSCRQRTSTGCRPQPPKCAWQFGLKTSGRG